jgi:hypothetical protein
MTLDHTPETTARVTQRDLYDAIRDSQRDSKGDLEKVEERLTTAIGDVGKRFDRYVEAHEGKHTEAAAALRAIAAALDSHLDDVKVEDAKADERTTWLRAAFGWTDRHLAIVLAVLAAFLALMGDVHLSIGLS